MGRISTWWCAVTGHCRLCGRSLLPQLISVTALSQLMLPVAQAGGNLLLAIIILGIVAATSEAALATTLSAGYTIASFSASRGASSGRRRRLHASRSLLLQPPFRY